MNWFLIDKSRTSQPGYGTYSDWKEILAAEGAHQCVYCGLPDARLGGIRNFHVEHFRPKSVFLALVNDIGNLYYSCPICNVFKSDDWPAEPDVAEPSYLDPSKVSYDSVFQIDRATLLLQSPLPAGRYMIESLNLNRRQLLRERRYFTLIAALKDQRRRIAALVSQLALAENDALSALLIALVDEIFAVTTTYEAGFTVSPYAAADTRRTP